MYNSDEDMQASPLPAKRKRTSHRRRSILSEQSQFWFADGDIVIGVERQSWKIHRSKLMCSVVFADMLELPQPVDIERMHGCPLVSLSQDSAKDWLVVLTWMYQRDKFNNQTVVFDTIAGALRISNKYDIPDLRQWSTHQLFLRWPQDITQMTYTAFPHAADMSKYPLEAICLARECEVPEILPAAFYALSILRWTHRADGGQRSSVRDLVGWRRADRRAQHSSVPWLREYISDVAQFIVEARRFIPVWSVASS
ncbi:uncharacterized protein EDB91DRAFT_1078460 [Suillus paluster]|uniref:uncharacterized protein n=1 Tax=Suillus paluster TaxID=48578 RepID=UPI001B8600C6|nr:uncharacterized protein EDB91DRAFT_1078460 [Suillus paluster]KAG1750421.1 hypothetical protein EDB91DRAFT_1078460 [Suillus paluster]